MPDLPPLSKRPFGFPVTAEHLRACCHPAERHPYHTPAVLDDATLAAGNGWLVIHAERFGFPAPAPASPAFLRRWDAINWQEPLWSAGTWKPLDDVAGLVWRFGPRPAWEKGGINWHLRRQPAVGIGPAATVPLGLLQLVARLPRATVRTETSAGSPVLIRFNGGRAMLANHVHAHLDTAFRIFAPHSDPLSR